MKVVCVSDTHSLFYPELPDGDMLIHAGDLSLTGEVHEIQSTLAWLRKMPHRYKIVIGGNHDNALAEMPGLFEEQFKAYKDRTPLIYLSGSGIKLEDGTRVFGASIQGHNNIYRIGARAYMIDSPNTERFWGYAPTCDILVTHVPPKGILDGTFGDAALRTYVNWVKPKLHVFGHIHTNYGMTEVDGTKFVNAALLNMAYIPTNKPIEVEV